MLLAALSFLACSKPDALVEQPPSSDPPIDLDQDGFVADQDCDDTNPAVHPGADELCGPIDEDCDGRADDDDDIVDLQSGWIDADQDGAGDRDQEVEACTLPPDAVGNDDDCDDGDASRHPGASEICDGVDQNCDGVADDGLPAISWFQDADQDGLGGPELFVSCNPHEVGVVPIGGDCDDTDAHVLLPTLHFPDNDGDGFGAGAGSQTCPGIGLSNNDLDCDDAAAAVNPEAEEICDGLDNDCDGAIETDVDTWYFDGDADGLGAGAPLITCDPPITHVLVDGDCDDGDDSITSPVPQFPDADGDGYGTEVSSLFCPGEPGWALEDADCDDSRDDVHPGATELCDGLDNDCDALVDDETETQDWFLDGDGDGHGAGSALSSCNPPADHVLTEGDCDDADPAIHPEAIDACNGLDEDCDGSPDPFCWTFDDADTAIEGTGGWVGQSLAAGDWDGDGEDELAVAAYFTDFVMVFDDVGSLPVVNTGLPQAAVSSGSNLTCFGCRISSTDLDGDGVVELAVGAATYAATADPDLKGGVFFFEDPFSQNTPADADWSTVSAPGRENVGDYFAARFGDLDGDGQADVVVGNTDTIADASGVYVAAAGAGLEDAFFTVRAPAGSTLGLDAVVMDCNGDGQEDLVVGDALGGAYGFFGPVGGTASILDADVFFDAPLGVGVSMAVGDFNGDGAQDLVLAGADEGLGGAAFGKFGPFGGDVDFTVEADFVISGEEGDGVGDKEVSLVASDLDGDGLDELLVGNNAFASGAGSVGIFFGENLFGARGFTSAGARIDGPAGSDSGQAIVVADFDGDGVRDVAVGAPAGNGGGAVFLGTTLGLVP